MNLYTYVFIILWKTGETLIGLRPPSADPTYRKLHHLPSIVPQMLPIKHHQIKNNTDKRLNKDLKTTKKHTDLQTNSFQNNSFLTYEQKGCDLFHSVKCSIRFLKSIIRQDGSECKSWQETSTCVCPTCENERCGIKKTYNAILKNLDCPAENIIVYGKQQCCYEELFKCTIDTYLNLNSKYGSCDIIEDYTACLAPLLKDLDQTKFDKIFVLLLSLTKTCIISLKDGN